MLGAAKILHDQGFLPCVAHTAYYSCFQLMKHIWLHSMLKTEDELGSEISQSHQGSHAYLLNAIANHIQQNQKQPDDSRNIRNLLPQLRSLRVKADYRDEDISSADSQKALALSQKIFPILKKY